MNLTELLNIIRSEKGSKLKKIKLAELYSQYDVLSTAIEYSYDVNKKYYLKPTQVKLSKTGDSIITSEFIKSTLDPLKDRVLTGNAAKDYVISKLETLTKEEQESFKLILKRDLRFSLNIKSINDALGYDELFDPPYMRCDTLTETTKKHIKFPAYVQLKADGMFVNIILKFKIENEAVHPIVEVRTRQGFIHENIQNAIHPIVEVRTRQGFIHENIQNAIQQDFVNLFKDIDISKIYETDGIVIHGEALIRGINDRKISNGIFNRDEIPDDIKDKIYIQCWDAVSYSSWATSSKDETHYRNRFNKLQLILTEFETGNLKSNKFEVIPTSIVNSYEEAFAIYSNYVAQGLEGAVIKDMNMPWEFKTSKYQLKMKIIFELDLRLVGLNPGTGRFESTFGSLKVASDDGLIESNVSGLSDSLRKYIFENKDDLINKIVEIRGNDLFEPTDGSKIYRISHPRVVEFRFDKDETDTLERALSIVESKRMLSNS